jgi:hypothetical protein
VVAGCVARARAPLCLGWFSRDFPWELWPVRTRPRGVRVPRCQLARGGGPVAVLPLWVRAAGEAFMLAFSCVWVWVAEFSAMAFCVRPCGVACSSSFAFDSLLRIELRFGLRINGGKVCKY